MRVGPLRRVCARSVVVPWQLKLEAPRISPQSVDTVTNALMDTGVIDSELIRLQNRLIRSLYVLEAAHYEQTESQQRRCPTLLRTVEQLLSTKFARSVPVGRIHLWSVAVSRNRLCIYYDTATVSDSVTVQAALASIVEPLTQDLKHRFGASQPWRRVTFRRLDALPIYAHLLRRHNEVARGSYAASTAPSGVDTDAPTAHLEADPNETVVDAITRVRAHVQKVWESATSKGGTATSRNAVIDNVADAAYSASRLAAADADALEGAQPVDPDPHDPDGDDLGPHMGGARAARGAADDDIGIDPLHDDLIGGGRAARSPFVGGVGRSVAIRGVAADGADGLFGGGAFVPEMASDSGGDDVLGRDVASSDMAEASRLAAADGWNRLFLATDGSASVGWSERVAAAGTATGEGQQAHVSPGGAHLGTHVDAYTLGGAASPSPHHGQSASPVDAPGLGFAEQLGASGSVEMPPALRAGALHAAADGAARRPLAVAPAFSQIHESTLAALQVMATMSDYGAAAQPAPAAAGDGAGGVFSLSLGRAYADPRTVAAASRTPRHTVSAAGVEAAGGDMSVAWPLSFRMKGVRPVLRPDDDQLVRQGVLTVTDVDVSYADLMADMSMMQRRLGPFQKATRRPRAEFYPGYVGNGEGKGEFHEPV